MGSRIPVLPRWASHRFIHLEANSELDSSRGRKWGVKAVIRPADLVPMIRSEGISMRPRSRVISAATSGTSSSSTAGLAFFPAASSSAFSFRPCRSAALYSSIAVCVGMVFLLVLRHFAEYSQNAYLRILSIYHIPFLEICNYQSAEKPLRRFDGGVSRKRI